MTFFPHLVFHRAADESAAVSILLSYDPQCPVSFSIDFEPLLADSRHEISPILFLGSDSCFSTDH